MQITHDELKYLLEWEMRLARIERNQLATIRLLDQVLAGVYQVQRTEVAMHKDLSDIEAEIAENASQTDSAVTLLKNLAALLKEHLNDPAKIDSIADQLAANSKRLAAAILETTPAPAPDPTPDPTPDPVPATTDPTPATPTEPTPDQPL